VDLSLVEREVEAPEDLAPFDLDVQVLDVQQVLGH
jgi:hypothetical protein